MERKKINSSCDPSVEHIIADCSEVTQLSENLWIKFVYVEKDGFDGSLIGISACEKDGTLIPGGLLIVEENGIWIRQSIENVGRLEGVFELDEDNKIKIYK